MFSSSSIISTVFCFSSNPSLNIFTFLPTISELFKKDIFSFAPDYLILIDYPGFNLRMAKWAHKNKIPVIYYILPQIWAWNERRIKYIEKYTQTRLAILPFEQAYYRNKNVSVHYVGNPLVEHIENFKKLNARVFVSNENASETKTIIALLPGSRIQEIKKHVPIYECLLTNPRRNVQNVSNGANR